MYGEISLLYSCTQYLSTSGSRAGEAVAKRSPLLLRARCGVAFATAVPCAGRRCTLQSQSRERTREREEGREGGGSEGDFICSLVDVGTLDRRRVENGSVDTARVRSVNCEVTSLLPDPEPYG